MRIQSLIALTFFIGQCWAPIGVEAQQLKPANGDGVSGPPIFKEVADQVGLSFRHYNGMTGKFFLPEIMGSGAAFFDYDNDGDLDVFIV
ncbi:MAG TPA: hypothetical protein VFU37_02760, partial [Pyrinomonadaceae bacterium]|nr:hypothetical protein [Pyrinomonadaceae bacterium]